MGCEHRDVRTTSHGATQGHGEKSPGMSCYWLQVSLEKGKEKARDTHSLGLCMAGELVPLSNQIIRMRVPICGRRNSLQCPKTKGSFQKLSSLYTWTFVEEIMFNLQIPCGAYSALIPGVGIRAPCADRGEDRPLQCRSLSVKETQNQALSP